MSHNSEVLFECLTDIDDRFIDEATSGCPDRKAGRRRKILYPALVAGSMVLCGFGYRLYAVTGAGRVSDIDSSRLEVPFDTSSAKSDIHEETEEDSTCSFISNKDSVLADHFKEINTVDGRIDSLYFSPGYMLVFSDDGEAWDVGNSGTIDVHLELVNEQPLTLECGYVDNGRYHKVSFSSGHEFSFSIKAENGHEYYLCITNYSSDNAVIETGNIEVDDQ